MRVGNTTSPAYVSPNRIKLPMKKNEKMISLYLLALLLLGCGNDTPKPKINPGNDPNFKIVPHNDKGMSAFNRKVVVFGLDIYAVPKADDAKLLHAANIMAQYLDNDEDGKVDDPKVLEALKKNRAYMLMWKKESDLKKINPTLPKEKDRKFQDLGSDETHPEWHKNKSGDFDASLEEVWHIISHAGYANAYPEVFGEKAGTTLSNAMDLARGGRHKSVPGQYPKNAWYTYDDRTCDYGCQVTEYFYWVLTSLLGAQENRLEEIKDEWKLNTKAKLQKGDPAVYKLLTNTKYRLPKKLPDGTYKR